MIINPLTANPLRQNLFADHQGSIVALATSASTIINRYDTFGIAGAANGGRFQYTGQIMLPELGLYHYKARAYAPGIGRFMQTDPIGYEDGVNWYDYVSGDAVNGRDPDGQVGFLIPVAIFIAKEIAGEVFEQTTGLPAPTVKRATREVGERMARAASTARGRASETRKLAGIGATRNTKASPTSTGPRIRDGTMPDGTHVEIKDTKRIDATQQLRGLDEAAGNDGKRLELHVGTRTNVSRNVNTQTMRNTDVIRCSTLGPKCK